ncbi:hypothetical protein D3C73_1329470 [compost metagenome]
MTRKVLHHGNDPLFAKPLHHSYAHLAHNICIIAIRTVSNNRIVWITVNIKNRCKIHIQTKSAQLSSNESPDFRARIHLACCPDFTR